MPRLIAVLAVSLITGTTFAQEIPDAARRQIAEALRGSYLVFRTDVQDDLKLSAEQKGTLEGTFPARVQETMAFFQKLEGARPEEREKALGEYRRKAHETLAATLKETLKDDQRNRLRQLGLQQEGAFALGGEVGKELKITDDQRKQFAAIVQDLQKEVEPLVKAAQSGGNPEEIRPQVLKLRKDHERQIEAVLTVDQRSRWKAMLGKPLDLEG